MTDKISRHFSVQIDNLEIENLWNFIKFPGNYIDTKLCEEVYSIFFKDKTEYKIEAIFYTQELIKYRRSCVTMTFI